MASWKIQGKQEEGKTFHKLQVLGMNDDLWDKVGGLTVIFSSHLFPVILLRHEVSPKFKDLPFQK